MDILICTSQNGHGGGFSGSVVPKQGCDLILVHVQRQLIHGHLASLLLLPGLQVGGQVRELERGRGGIGIRLVTVQTQFLLLYMYHVSSTMQELRIR